jgi:adenosylhomocysteine nucleosidase
MEDAPRQTAGVHAEGGENAGADDEAAQRSAEVIPAPRQCAAAVVFGDRSEAGCFEDLLRGAAATKGEDVRIVEGDLDGRRVAVLAAGDDSELAARAVQALLDGHRPRVVISAGFAVALSQELTRGQLIVATEVTSGEGENLALDGGRFGEALQAINVARGRLACLAESPRTPDEKAELAARLSVLAADRQPLAVVRTCLERHAPLVVVRMIVEEAGEELPAHVSFAAAQPSKAGRFGAVVGALFRRPSSMKDFYRRKEQMLVLGDRFAAALKRLIAALAPASQDDPD